MSTKTENAMASAVDALLGAGFAPDGKTHEQVVRVPSKSSPLLGRSGGELITLGDRQRFSLQGTNIKATVGPRTTSIYRIEGSGINGVHGIATHNTTDTAAIQATLEELVQTDALGHQHALR